MERSTGFSVQRNAFDIGIRVILPFFFRNFLLLLFLFPEGYVGVKHQKPLPGKTGNGFWQRKRMRWEGKGGKYYLSVSFAKHLLNLVMEFSSFSPIPARVVTEGSWLLYGREWMGGGRGGVVREVREHSSVALAAVNFLSFPIPLLRLCWGSIKILRFSFPSHVLAVHWQHITILELSTTTLFTSPLLCPHLLPIVHSPSPLLFISPPPQTSRLGSFQWSNFIEWLCRSLQK